MQPNGIPYTSQSSMNSSEQIVAAIFNELFDRRAFRWGWDQCESQDRAEIWDTLVNLVTERLYSKPTTPDELIWLDIIRQERQQFDAKDF